MRNRGILSRVLAPGLGLSLALLWVLSCASGAGDGADEKVTTLGELEVTARLEEIRGEFADQTNYDYAFVMKYTVLKTHRGKPDGKVIYVGHYNPLTPRAEVADERVPEVGGTLKKFRAGDVHRMALSGTLDDNFMGGVINRYFEEHKGPVHWAVWTNPAGQP